MATQIHPDAARPLDDYSVPSLERGMAILELLAGRTEGMSLTDIAQTLGLSKNSVFRIGQALVHLGYLTRDAENKRFAVSRKLLLLGLSSVHETNIVERSYEILREFRDEVGESVALATLLPAQTRGVILASLEGLGDFGYFLRVGLQFELHCSGPGKAILAFLPEVEYQRMLARMSFKALTQHTITKPADLSKDLEEVRRTGYALDLEEYLAGGRCVGSPILDVHGYPIAAIWVGAPSEHLPTERLPEIGRRVKHYAAKISQRLA